MAVSGYSINCFIRGFSDPSNPWYLMSVRGSGDLELCKVRQDGGGYRVVTVNWDMIKDVKSTAELDMAISICLISLPQFH